MRIGIGQIPGAAPGLPPTLMAGRGVYTIPDYAQGQFTSPPIVMPTVPSRVAPTPIPVHIQTLTPAPRVHTVKRTPAHRQPAAPVTAPTVPVAKEVPPVVLTPQNIAQPLPSITDSLRPEFIPQCSQWEELNATIARNPVVSVAVAVGIFAIIASQKRRR